MYSEHHLSVTAHRTRVGFSIPVSFSVAIQLLIYLVIPFFYFIQINSVYQSWFWLDIGTSGSHTRLSWTIFCLPPLSPNMDSFLQKETEHSWDLRLIIWQLSLLWMRSSPLWKHRMPSWISCWHLGIFTCTCANTDTISYITLPICTVRDIHSVSENIIFPKHRKVHDLNLYREENTSEPLILIRKLLQIFQNGLILHYQMASST